MTSIECLRHPLRLCRFSNIYKAEMNNKRFLLKEFLNKEWRYISANKLALDNRDEYQAFFIEGISE